MKHLINYRAGVAILLFTAIACEKDEDLSPSPTLLPGVVDTPPKSIEMNLEFDVKRDFHYSSQVVEERLYGVAESPELGLLELNATIELKDYSIKNSDSPSHLTIHHESGSQINATIENIETSASQIGSIYRFNAKVDGGSGRFSRIQGSLECILSKRLNDDGEYMLVKGHLFY